jgi:hypothetical protein
MGAAPEFFAWRVTNPRHPCRQAPAFCFDTFSSREAGTHQSALAIEKFDQQHDRIALTGDQVVQPDAVDLGEFALRLPQISLRIENRIQ